MSRDWSVRRQGVARPDGLRRWDQAYPHLLQWATAVQPNPHPQEGADACGDVCARLDGAPGASADGRAASESIADVRGGAGVDA
jgi:hypothetical protein